MDGCVIDLFSELAENEFGFFRKVTSVAKIMSANVHTLSLEDTYEHTAELFRRHSIHHAPVVEDGDVIGIVSDRDLLRHRPPLLGKVAEDDDAHLVLKNTVSSFMTRGPLYTPSTGSPIAALSQMIDNRVDSVLVHDEDRKLEGILTPRNFMKLLLLFNKVCTHGDALERFRLVDLDLRRGFPLDFIFSRGTRSVRDVMKKEVRCLSPSDSIDSAMELMKMLKVRHLPVVDESQKLLGMVSDREILKFLPLPVPRPKLHPSTEFRETMFAVDDKRPLREPVSLIMEKDPEVVRPADFLSVAIDILLTHSVGGVAVVDPETGRLCGLVTSTDILRVIRVTLQMGALLNSPLISAPEWENALA